jgi:hypothetical protein
VSTRFVGISSSDIAPTASYLRLALVHRVAILPDHFLFQHAVSDVYAALSVRAALFPISPNPVTAVTAKDWVSNHAYVIDVQVLTGRGAIDIVRDVERISNCVGVDVVQKISAADTQNGGARDALSADVASDDSLGQIKGLIQLVVVGIVALAVVTAVREISDRG